ncbi:MAG TPA: hypothetical protein VLA11_02680 [Woeseiaceae bacterium]|jgi:hypothetical protein|nr:hypothetical protein [Woeseiaceae bacterium]
MRFAEVFVRLGSSLVGWMLVYTYAVWLGALHALGCGPDGDGMHRLLLGIAPFAAVMTLLLGLTRPFPDIHRILSWLAVPLALLLPFILRNTWTVFARANMEGLTICGSEPAATLDQIWAPAQLLAVFVISFQVIRVWRAARIATR